MEGGSTITQQLAKNQYFTQDKKIVRKISEMFMAFKIESVLDKDKILELYVNSIFFGNGNYCVGDAAEYLFWETAFPDELRRVYSSGGNTQCAEQLQSGRKP